MAQVQQTCPWVRPGISFNEILPTKTGVLTLYIGDAEYTGTDPAVTVDAENGVLTKTLNVGQDVIAQLTAIARDIEYIGYTLEVYEDEALTVVVDEMTAISMTEAGVELWFDWTAA